MALVVAQEVPASSSMAVPHGPAGVGEARHRMRAQLRGGGVAESVIDDAVLILSELLSNACKHGRPLGDASAGDGDVRAAWRVDARGRLIVEVTDGGGPTRPAPATPSVTAHGGRGLNIITALADDWGVRDDVRGEVTVWALVHEDVHDPDAGCRHDAFPPRATRAASPRPVPDLARPGLPAPDVSLPDLSRPDLSRADLARTDLSRTDLSRPGVPRPGVSRPGASRPGVSLPELSGLGFSDAFEDLD